ncbi:MAG: ATP-binding protein [Paracoccus sp. (in: a-proteobacteria)]|nr:ATP-binding protein [Paracoccus sp. (in: a-proteobacteria)]
MGKDWALLPRHALLWLPLLMLPLVVGDIWLRVQGARPNPGGVLSLAALSAAFAWYILGGGIAMQHALRGIAARRALRGLRDRLARSEDALWAIDLRGQILAQSDSGLRDWGDQIGRGFAFALDPFCADSDSQAERLMLLAQRHGAATLRTTDGRELALELVASGRLILMTLQRAAAPKPASPESFDDDRLPVAILRLSADGAITHANRASIPYCGDAPVGRHISALFDGLGRPFDDWLADILAGRSTDLPEVLRSRATGQNRFIQVLLKRDPERPRALIAVLTDARALKTLEAQFVQSQKMQAIGQLAGGIAHDFNNLLTAISGHCDLLMLRHDKGDPNYADLDQIGQNANRAANLVGQLLAFSRKQTLHPDILDLRDTISDLTHLLNRLVGEKVQLGFSHDSALYAVRADKGKIEQVIFNLVVNARDAMAQGGAVTISTRNMDFDEACQQDRYAIPPGRYVCVEISDEGVGIPADILPKIFEPFFTTKKPGEGTGLGLATVYGIIKQTGGYITCKSEPAAGTTFSIYLPACTEEERQEAARAAQAAAPAAQPTLADAASRHVLLVEDEAPVRAFASRALQLRGYRVSEAASGEEALEMLADDRLEVDIFVTDVVMPGLDGLAWVRRALKDRPDTKVIFISGYAEDVFEDGRTRIEGAGFLQKPFSLNALTDAVAQKLAPRAA